MVEGQMTLGVNGRPAVGVSHAENIARNMASVTWQHAHHPRINYAIGIGKGATHSSAFHGYPLGAANEMHIILGIAPSLVRQMEMKAKS